MAKRKYDTCHQLEFARQLCSDGRISWMQDLKTCEDSLRRNFKSFRQQGFMESEEETIPVARAAYTVNAWLKTMQCYAITPELAEDLFSMVDFNFSLDLLNLPFPVFYLDFTGIRNLIPQPERGVLQGIYIHIGDIPYGEEICSSFCSFVTLSVNENGEYAYGCAAFDYYRDHMDKTLEETVDHLTSGMPDVREYIRYALLFAAYLSSEKPEIEENEAQKQIYRPSASGKPKYSGIRKWDVGIRYAKEKRRLQMGQKEEKETLELGAGKRRHSPRVHMRKAHWRTVRYGTGRKGRRLVWIPPTMVGMQKADPMPVMVRICEK